MPAFRDLALLQAWGQSAAVDRGRYWWYRTVAGIYGPESVQLPLPQSVFLRDGFEECTGVHKLSRRHIGGPVGVVLAAGVLAARFG